MLVSPSLLFIWSTPNSVITFLFPSRTSAVYYSNGGIILLFKKIVLVHVSRFQSTNIGCNFPTRASPFFGYFFHVYIPHTQSFENSMRRCVHWSTLGSSSFHRFHLKSTSCALLSLHTIMVHLLTFAESLHFPSIFRRCSPPRSIRHAHEVIRKNNSPGTSLSPTFSPCPTNCLH